MTKRFVEQDANGWWISDEDGKLHGPFINKFDASATLKILEKHDLLTETP